MTVAFEFQLQFQDQQTGARAGLLHTPHGLIETPVFMPVGTLGSVKGLAPEDLHAVGAQIILANTYHLMLRPGEDLIAEHGGLAKWTNWQKPMLTDSGGFQVFSLGEGNKKGNNNVKISDDGVKFKSHLDGSSHFLTPEKVMEIETKLGADIIMQLDECAPVDSSKEYAQKALDRTHAWAERSLIKHQELEKQKLDSANPPPPQALFPIIQGTIHHDLRIASTKFQGNLPCHGVAIGGLSVGEKNETMYEILSVIQPHLPVHKPHYLMGVGTPKDLLESIERGIDMFDCVHATRIARHGCFYDQDGRQHITNNKYKNDPTPLDPTQVNSPIKQYSKSYIRHLFQENEMLALRLLSMHNLYFLIELTKQARQAILTNSFSTFKNRFFSHFKSEK